MAVFTAVEKIQERVPKCGVTALYPLIPKRGRIISVVALFILTSIQCEIPGRRQVAEFMHDYILLYCIL